ncbi:SDR family NAD(P)-dependent oxidoreductase, partial [Methylobacterium sp. B1]|uniref:SDR family NAD(P)-dependent oxidoreductase n=1 Tax=Methylobacterium sp. B1 TaxID=91459 RepID=UPI002072C3A0
MAEAAGHILVVGASSGIGRAVAERFAAQGSVTALARRTDRLAELAAAGIATVAADVTASRSWLWARTAPISRSCGQVRSCRIRNPRSRRRRSHGNGCCSRSRA